jgi:undecaprenyl pyrophosphate phosphatase UppP
MTAYLVALVLGLVEGLTEFLPISSTGHLVLASALLGQVDDKGKVFDVVIQSGAVLAIVFEYRERFAATVRGLWRPGPERAFAVNVAIAFLPLAVLGLLFGKALKAALFNATSIAAAFIVGALIIRPRLDAPPASLPLRLLLRLPRGVRSRLFGAFRARRCRGRAALVPSGMLTPGSVYGL